jgi:hypothetical protein
MKKVCLPVPKKWLLLDYTHQLHQIKFKQKQGSDVLEWLKFVCYEIALNQGPERWFDIAARRAFTNTA